MQISLEKTSVLQIEFCILRDNYRRDSFKPAKAEFELNNNISLYLFVIYFTELLVLRLIDNTPAILSQQCKLNFLCRYAIHSRL